MALPLFEKDMNIISKLSDEPNNTKNEGLDGHQLKDKFDEGGEALKQYLNEVLLPYLEGVQAAASLGIATISGISGATNVQEALEALKKAIDNTSAGAIPDASLGGGKLIAKTITAREMADGSIGENALINGAVAEQKVADNGITKEKLADRSVEARHLNKQIISDENIADNSIDASGKLKSGSLTAKLFAAQSVGETAIVDGSVTNAKLAASSVGTSKLIDGSITGKKIESGAVTREKLAADTLSAPMRFAGTAEYTVALSDIGKMITVSASVSSSSEIIINVDDTLADAPSGAEFALLYRRGTSYTIKFAGSQYSACLGLTTWNTNRQYAITDLFGIVVVKKVDYGSNTNYWLLTGNVEAIT